MLYNIEMGYVYVFVFIFFPVLTPFRGNHFSFQQVKDIARFIAEGFDSLIWVNAVWKRTVRKIASEAPATVYVYNGKH